MRHNKQHLKTYLPILVILAIGSLSWIVLRIADSDQQEYIFEIAIVISILLWVIFSTKFKILHYTDLFGRSKKP